MKVQRDEPAAPRLGAVLLAAGAGSRIGGRPKGLLELEGVPIVRRLVLALLHAGVDDVVVVLGHHAAAIAAAVAGLPVTLVHNPRPDDGPVSSQRLGLAALASTHDAVIMALVDQPLVNAADVSALITAFTQRPGEAAVIYPEVGGLRGNPVLLSAAVRAQILAAGAQMGCRQWQVAHPEATLPLVCGNHHYRVDIDTEADRARFERDTGRLLRWPVHLVAG